jgi:uncharacterized membrane protein YedE/YeeE
VPALGLWRGALGATYLYEAPGAGRTATLVLVGAQIVVPAGIWEAWPGGSPDLVVLLAWAMSAGATACAAAWRPTARALAELAAGPREVTMAPGTAES